jgi:hypothetical protein
MWNIDSTTELLKAMSASREPVTSAKTPMIGPAGALMIKTQRHMCTYIQARKGL